MKYLVKHENKDGSTKLNRFRRRELVAAIRHKGDTPHALGKRFKKKRKKRITGSRRQAVGKR